MYSVEEALKFKHADYDLFSLVRVTWSGEDISNKDIEDIEYEGKHFSLIQVDKDDIVSEGKYNNGGEYWQLVEFEPTQEKDWCCEETIVAKYDIQIYTGWFRTGSYYTEWYYEYDEPVYSQIVLKDVPEIIIPAHKEVEMVEL